MAQVPSVETLTRAFELQRLAEEQTTQQQQAADAAAAAEVEATRSNTWGEAFGNLIPQAVSGAVSVAQAGYGLTNLASLGLLDRATGLSSRFDETQQILAGMQSAPTQRAAQDVHKAFGEGVIPGLKAAITSPAFLQQMGVQTLPSMIPVATAARFAGGIAAEGAIARNLGLVGAREAGAKAAEKAVILTTGGQIGGQTNVDAINSIREAGGSENQQQFGGWGAGVASGFAGAVLGKLTGAARLESAAANALPGGVPAAAVHYGLVPTILGGAAREMTEESAQSATQQLATNAVTPGKRLFDGVGEQAAVGGLLGGLMGGAMGGVISASTPRSSTATPLGQRLRAMMGKSNSELDAPLQPNAIAPLPDVEEMAPESPEEAAKTDSDYSKTPLPGGVVAGDPLPRRTLYDITGRSPTQGMRPPISGYGVEELPPEQRTGLLGVLDLQRHKGVLGGGDLAGGQLDWQGAFPDQAPQVPRVADAPAMVDANQGSLDFNAPPPTWKKHLAREMGVKPDILRGPQWNQLVQAAEQAGVTPGTAEGDAFLRQIAPLLASAAKPAPFTGALATKYAPDPVLQPESAVPADVAARFAQEAQRAQSTQSAQGVDPAQTTQGVVSTQTQQVAQSVDPTQSPQGVVSTQVAQPSALSNLADMLKVPPVVESTQAAQPAASADQMAWRGKRKQPPLTTRERLQQSSLTPERREQLSQQIASGQINRQAALRAGDAAAVRHWRLQELTAVLEIRQARGQTSSPALERQIADLTKKVEGQKAAVLTIVQAKSPPVPVQPSTPGSPAVGPVTAPVSTVLEGVDKQIADNLRFDPSITRTQAAADAYTETMMGALDSDALDQTFIDIKGHPDWGTLSKPQQDQVVRDFEQRYDALESPGKFDRATDEVAKPIHVTDFQQGIAAANRNAGAGNPQVIGVEDVATFENLTNQAAPPDARGVFTDGKIYLIRENISSPEQMAITLAHERGHHGLAALLGDRMQAVLNRLWTNPATRTRIKAKMAALQAGDVDVENGGLRKLAAEEVLADMFAAGEKVNGDILTKARNAIEQTFATLLGVGKLRMNNNDVDSILRDVSAVLKGTSADVLRKGDPIARDLPGMMADPTPWTMGNPRFSRAIADVDEIIRAANAEQDGTRRNLADVIVDVGKASLSMVRGLGTATVRDKIASGLLNAMPLNQIANAFDKLMEGRLGNFARLKRAQESMHNKLLTQERELELHGKKYTTSPQALSKQWVSFARRNPDKATALSQLQQDATMYRVWPGRKFEEQSKVGYETTSFTEDERRAASERVNKLWGSMGTEGQEIFNKSQALYDRAWNTRFETLRKLLADKSKPADMSMEEYVKTADFKTAFGNMIDTALAKMRQGPYSPLQRYGDYLLTVRDKDGKIAFFDGYDTIEQRNLAERDLRQGQFAGTDYVIAPTKRMESSWGQMGLDQQAIDRLENVAATMFPATNPDSGETKSAKDLRQALVEAYLQSLPQHSFMQHANQRKNVKSGPIDAMRGFNDYMGKSSRNIAGLEFNHQISSALTGLGTFVTEKAQGKLGVVDGDTLTKMGRVLNAVRAQHEASTKYEHSPVADMISGAGFLMFMSSPSQLFVNGMQVFMVTMPRLAGMYGNTPAIRALKGALTDFAKSRGNLLGDKSVVPKGSLEHQVLNELFIRGTLDLTQAHDMNGLGNGEGSAMSGHWRKVMEVAGMFMHKSEVFNRQVTALAAARLEVEKTGANIGGLTADQVSKLVNKLADSAEDMVTNTQFDYSQANGPKLMQGPWRKVIFQFQKYRVNMLAMLAKDLSDIKSGTPEERASARRALSWMLGMQLALTGAAGTVLAPVAFGIADLFRDDDDLLDSRTEFVRSYPQWLTHGVLSGWLDTSRIGADGLLSGGGAYAPTDASAKESFQYYVLKNIGPWAGLGANIFTGVDKALQGDHVAAVKNLAPAGVRDIYRALFESQQGAKDSRQVVYFEPSIWDTMSTAMGLKSGSRRDAEELRGAAFEATMHSQTIKKRIVGRLALGFATGDAEMIAGAQQDRNDYNDRYRDMPISGATVRQAMKNRVRSQMNADQTGVASARPLSQSIQDEIGLE